MTGLSHLDHFHGARIEVTRDGWTRRGRVSVTTGWKPALLLMHRRSDRSSADVLDERDHLVRVVSP